MPNKRAKEPGAELVRAELIPSPAMQAQTRVDIFTIKELVAAQVAEMLSKTETAIFEPFFRNRQVAYALRRLQTIPEQRVHAIRYQRGGCMVCKGDDTQHGGLGMCTRCYAREFQVRKRLLKELMDAADEGRQI